MDETYIRKCNYPADAGISRIIKEKGMKQVHIAKKAGYRPHELCDMLHGRKLIKACDILKLSIVLGVTAGDIYVAGETGGEAINE